MHIKKFAGKSSWKREDVYFLQNLYENAHTCRQAAKMSREEKHVSLILISTLATQPEFSVSVSYSMYLESSSGHRDGGCLKMSHLWVSTHPRMSVTVPKLLHTSECEDTAKAQRTFSDSLFKTYIIHVLMEVDNCIYLFHFLSFPLSLWPLSHWFLAFSSLCLLDITLETELVWSHLSTEWKDAFVNKWMKEALVPDIWTEGER